MFFTPSARFLKRFRPGRTCVRFVILEGLLRQFLLSQVPSRVLYAPLDSVEHPPVLWSAHISLAFFFYFLLCSLSTHAWTVESSLFNIFSFTKKQSSTNKSVIRIYVLLESKLSPYLLVHRQQSCVSSSHYGCRAIRVTFLYSRLVGPLRWSPHRKAGYFSNHGMKLVPVGPVYYYLFLDHVTVKSSQELVMQLPLF